MISEIGELNGRLYAWRGDDVYYLEYGVFEWQFYCVGNQWRRMAVCKLLCPEQFVYA